LEIPNGSRREDGVLRTRDRSDLRVERGNRPAGASPARREGRVFLSRGAIEVQNAIREIRREHLRDRLQWIFEVADRQAGRRLWNPVASNDVGQEAMIAMQSSKSMISILASFLILLWLRCANPV
jgi:hypothetical protein